MENHISRSDEIPETVTLPVGSYVIEARSEKNGYVRVRVAIKAGQQTILDLDSRDSSFSEFLPQKISGIKPREIGKHR